jgi:hypothetical protein
VGLHAHYAYIDAIFNTRKEGDIFGAGASYGYSWTLGSKWRLEGVAGLGYARLNYLVYNKNGEQIGGVHHYNYAGPTKLAINLIYVIK